MRTLLDLKIFTNIRSDNLCYQIPPGFHEGINKVRLKSKGNIKMSLIFAAVELADLLHVDQQRLPVVLPLDGKLAGVRKLIAGQLHRHLEAVGVQVAEIVHACEKKGTEKELCCLREAGIGLILLL